MRAMNEDKLEKLAEYIKQYARENNGDAPRLSDIMSHMNMAKATAYRYVLELEKRGAYEFGYLVYFFELGCAISGYTLGVNPFNQPGVEAYKKNMFALLGKPGEENERLRVALTKKM